MEPRVTKGEKKLHLSWEVSHRIYSSRIYPVLAPNGSHVIFYGHSRGLRIIWRGGQRSQKVLTSSGDPQRKRPSGALDDVQTKADGDDRPADGDADDVYTGVISEDGGHNQDPDTSYPSIVCGINVDLETEVLSLAVPDLLPASVHPSQPLFTTAVIIISDSNGQIRVLRVPLDPPSSREVHKYVATVKKSEKVLQTGGKDKCKLALKFELPQITSENQSELIGSSKVICAAVSDRLRIWQWAVDEHEGLEICNQKLPFSGVSAAFHPSPKLSQILLGDSNGALRVFDYTSIGSPSISPNGNRDGRADYTRPEHVGIWTISLQTPFLIPKSGLNYARRKRIQDAKWVLNGRGIIVLLEDGEWGIWDISGQPQSNQHGQDFTISGSLDQSRSADPMEGSKSKIKPSKLAPMTPNTRRSKAESLFKATPRANSSIPRGGISLSTTSTHSNHTDDSLVMWYGSDIFAITSLQGFWQRSTSTAGSTGSLYAPGVIHLNEINLNNEDVNSISQLVQKSSPVVATNHNTTLPDILIALDHRIIIVQTVAPPTRTRNLFEQALPERPSLQDQRMLHAGQLGLDGMDRILDNMAGERRPRKVGFVGQ